jgi:hypothetical protein
MVTKDRKVFFLYTGVIFTLIIIAFTTLYIFHATTVYYNVTRVYNIVEYFFLSYFFSLFLTNKFFRSLLLYSSIPFLIYCIFDYFISGKPQLPFFPLAIEYVTLLFFLIYFFFEIMKSPKPEPIYQKAVFWIAVAFIVNFSGNFFLFLYSKNSFNDEVFKKQYTYIYTTVTLIKNILLCISAFINENKYSNDHYPKNHALVNN